ncbi:MAG: hypothetical protein GTN70_00065 [Deltaproteobacteria bacterium]|nr:hypothetical protein [Deltaproteobacteria bacterium]NIS76054.1 hypothetical protein [Deltaproteobacteria bacterium]
MVRIIKEVSMREFFEERFDEALSANPLELPHLTRSYLVELLTEYAESETAFSLDREDPELPLSIRFLRATAKGTREKLQDCKRIGDFCLFLSGIFPEKIQGKAADLDFYMALGSKAYLNVESSLRNTTSHAEDCFVRMFRELSERFPEFVGLYMDVSERMRALTDRNIMDLYGKYLLLRSRRHERILRKAGISPPPPNPTRH